MSTGTEDPTAGDGSAADGDAPQQQLRIFINYRRGDTDGQALLLHDRLAARFGAENVFLDVRSLQPGMKWLEAIKERSSGCGVFLALIGPQWLSTFQARAQDARAHAAEDYVRYEIEYALRNNSSVELVPVIVGNAVPPGVEGLPKALHPLTRAEVELLRHERFDEDVAHLIGRLETIARDAAERERERPAVPVSPPPPAALPTLGGVSPPPDEAHFGTVLRHLVDEGNLVVLLGSRLNRSAGQEWREGCGWAPDAHELAATLARQVNLDVEPLDLAEVAQYVYETKGRADLYRPLSKILTGDCEPGPVHRFLAGIPAVLEDRDVEQRHQLIVTTNFDTALERAFDDANEPYDLAVYMASGPDKGKFVHFPHGGVAPEPIAVPNAYGRFPIGDYGELERTVIVKIHGAVDGSFGDFRWRENYVITEDHYIEYLSRSPVESLVPMQILDKLRDSHCLFLGYTIRDWYVRVFLKRIWSGQPLGAKSWAISPDADVLEKEFWTHSNVDLYTAETADYVEQLRARLAAWAAANA